MVRRVIDLFKKMQAALTQDAANDRVIMDKMDCCMYAMIQWAPAERHQRCALRVSMLKWRVRARDRDMHFNGKNLGDAPRAHLGVCRRTDRLRASAAESGGDS